MSIQPLASSASNAAALRDILRKNTSSEDPLAENSAQAIAAPEVRTVNYAVAVFDKDKYAKARQAASESDNTMTNRQNGILAAGLAELAAAKEEGGGYAQRLLIGRRAARKMLRERDQTVTEESERNLKETRDRLEEKAREAAAPTDADGKPIITDAAAPQPEIPEVNTGADMPESDIPSRESTAPAPEVAQPDTADAPEQAQASAAPSVNIVV